MKNYLLYLLIFIIPLYSVAQNIQSNESILIRKHALDQLTGEKYYDPGDKHVNVHYKQNWLPGTIITSSGVLIENVPLKYNGSINHLILKTDKHGEIKIDNDCISEFLLTENNKIYHFEKLSLDTLEIEKNLFCQLIFNNKIKVYVSRKVRADITKFKDDGIYRIYKPKPVYILFVNSRIILLNRATSKVLFEQFPELEEKIEANKLHVKRIKSEDDFIRFIQDIEGVLIEFFK